MTLEMILLITILSIVSLILIIIVAPYLVLIFKSRLVKNKYNKLGKSSQIRLINQLRESVEYLSKNKIGALITIENNDNLDNLRTDGIIVKADISSSLLISIFNKTSPLHDGAVIIRDNKIWYVGTFYKISRKSIENGYGARHRAAMGISELCDATTIIVSEETGSVKFVKNGAFYNIRIDQFQEQLIKYLKD
ncbi:DNA integrity scanning protein DisA nucleotide-binding domain protein [Mycoplasma sp. Mirounga ES2805-ORL]|uniref:diadenylate cyclase n=1 Tax=Mycoplasma sp. Mirounga ES2805-ORL TaxID=754514 RepID=UPI00197C5C51|nr:DNA integrity scanning protein DisA nucleotide-binding domain protein [Mycoplasma sp. Mirounga ES2805-ORL]QSF13869.1 DNA integrity scanning protein DisA nucleotide-binding domain protein [Mycoplasma sp. Mirounga ES2805-ORL]